MLSLFGTKMGCCVAPGPCEERWGVGHPAAQNYVGLAIPAAQCINNPGPSAVGRVLQGAPSPGER